MIVVDTNVISEMMRISPSAEVRAWFKAQTASSLFTTAISQAEILFGIQSMPPGGRRSGFHEAAGVIFTSEFAGRILPFDSDAADFYALVAASRKRAGLRMHEMDAQIAAIARSRGAVLATRNVSDFVDCGIKLVNPWDPT